MYFYHLKFELYSPKPDKLDKLDKLDKPDRPDKPDKPGKPDKPASVLKHTPTRIFDRLPSHPAAPAPLGKPDTKSPTKTSHTPTPVKSPLRSRRNSHKEKAIAQPPSNNSVALDNIPEIPPTPAPTSESSSAGTSSSFKTVSIRRKSSATEDSRKLDFRFGKIEIEWVDNQTMADNTNQTDLSQSNYASIAPNANTLYPPSTTGLNPSLTLSPSPSPSTSTTLASQIQPPTGAFVPLSGRTNLDYGILHLYRDPNEIPKEEEPPDTQERGDEVGNDQGEGRGTVVCVLAVPTYMSAADFLNFVAPVNQCVSHYRIIRDSAPNKFMVLMKFRDAQSASEFYQQYNGKAFSSMEPEICHVVYIKSVEFKSTSAPPFLHDVITAPEAAVAAPDVLDDDGLYELPTCPVCLERMDASVTGLLTILCQHTFHCYCLSKWGDGSCPVCRYSQKRFPTSSSPIPSSFSGPPVEGSGAVDDANECSECSATESLWICLICGHIGCGRYQEAHAYHHYTATHHLYALELETQRVWDYAGDGYVHRLIQNKTDGKLVELPSANSTTDEQNPRISQEKLEAISLEYTHLLTTQLDSQRTYYEGQLTAVTTQLSALAYQLGGLSLEVAALRGDNEEAVRGREQVEREKKEVERAKQGVEKRLENLQEKYEKAEKEREEEKELNISLRANQDQFKASLAAKDTQISELEEQVRDLMVFLETRERVQADPELREATVQAVATPPSPQETSGGRRRGKRR